MIGTAAHDHQPRPPYARETQTLSISVVPSVPHWQWLLHRINRQPSACMYVCELLVLSLSVTTRYYGGEKISVSVTTMAYRGGYSRTEQVGGLNLRTSGAVRRYPQIYSLEHQSMSLFLFQPESAGDISRPFASCTVDPRYPKIR